MQWWCAAQSSAWTWSWQAYPGVWLFILAIGLAYWRRSRRWSRAGGADGDPAAASPTAGTGLPPRGRPAWFVAGLLCLWAALDWPIGALGAGYLAGVHMLQFVLIALVSPALLLLGIPPGRPDLGRRTAMALKVGSQPLIALILFNLIIIVTHLPAVVDSLMVSQLGSFAIDVLWLAGGILFWWPVVLDRPARPYFGYPMKIGYLILATIVNAGTFLYLTFSELPVYATYELAPPVYGLSARDDQRIAGILMKVGTVAVLWTAISVLFYRWYLRESVEAQTTAGGGSDDAP